MIKKQNLSKKIFICSFLSVIFVLNVLTNSLPKSISVYENSRCHIGLIKNKNEAVTVLENSTKPLATDTNQNIKIDLLRGKSFVSKNSGVYKLKYTVLGLPLKTVNLNVLPKKEVYVCGNTIGIVIYTKGVLVLGTGSVECENGEKVSPSLGLIKTGDSIISVDGKEMFSKEDFLKAVSESNGKALNISLIRNGIKQKVYVTPVKNNTNKKYTIGCWIRDDTQGLGTLTFTEPKNNTFGALGHGIYDVDTAMITPVSHGEITKAEISGVKKGKCGDPGEIIGNLDKNIVIGNVDKNTECGIYGSIKNKNFFNQKLYDKTETAISSEVHTGKAYIKSDVLGKSELYDAEIESINRFDISSDKSMTIKITDKRLLDTTGGIIQGMSGSPIIQDGKLSGAITHVFLNNPQKGYGIFIDNMLMETENNRS